MKRILSLLLALTLLTVLLPGCGKTGEADALPETVTFTDSLSRQVELPAEITRIAPSGAVATMFLATVAPEYMVCVSSVPGEAQLAYLPQELASLPETGQMYGSKATLNLETLLGCAPQVIIDLGDKKGDMAADLDALQEQIGIPVIFIESDLAHMEQAFRTLGTLLGREERGNALADFTAETLAMAEENSAKVQADERVSVMYTSGTSGLDTNALGSTQSQVLPLIGADNAVVVENVSSKGGGNPINMEQLYGFDPDVILFAADSIYDTAADDPAWQQLSAVQSGRYYEIPSMPYNWLSNPPSLNMLLGVWWLGNLLYPQYYDYDMVEKTQEYFSLLWNKDLSGAQAQEILAFSTLK